MSDFISLLIYHMAQITLHHNSRRERHGGNIVGAQKKSFAIALDTLARGRQLYPDGRRPSWLCSETLSRPLNLIIPRCSNWHGKTRCRKKNASLFISLPALNGCCSYKCGSPLMTFFLILGELQRACLKHSKASRLG